VITPFAFGEILGAAVIDLELRSFFSFGAGVKEIPKRPAVPRM
jgi:hypothetical protein